MAGPFELAPIAGRTPAVASAGTLLVLGLHRPAVDAAGHACGGGGLRGRRRTGVTTTGSPVPLPTAHAAPVRP